MDNRHTDSGISIQTVFTPDDLPGHCTQVPFELPGQFPYTRGVQADMYRGKGWTMRQYAGFSTAEESNRRYHYLLSQGVTGLSVAFDLPTQIGYDSDHPLSEGEVGKVGVAIDSLADMERLFEGIELEKVSTSMTINATGFILLALYVALAKKQGADLLKSMAPYKMISLKNMLPAALIFIHLNHLCASLQMYSNGAAVNYPSGIPFQFQDITFVKPVPQQFRKLLSH